MEINWTVVQAISAMAAAIVSIWTLLVVYNQLQQANQSLKQSYHVSLYSANAEINKIFVEKPYLRPYFYDKNKELAFESKDLENQVFGLAELYADQFESIFLEKKSLSEEVQNPWNEYISNIYQNSNAFRQFMAQHQNQYSQDLRSFLSGILVEQSIKIEFVNPT